MAKPKATSSPQVIPWLDDMPLPAFHRKILELTKRDYLAADMFTAIVELDLSGRYDKDLIAMTDEELAERLQCATRTLRRKRAVLRPLGLSVTDGWSEHHNEPHVNRYGFDVPRVRKLFSLPVEEEYVPSQEHWPEWAKDENVHTCTPDRQRFSKPDKESTYPFNKQHADGDSQAPACGPDSSANPQQRAGPGRSWSDVPPAKRQHKNNKSRRQRKRRTALLEAHVEKLGLGNTMLFARRRPVYDAFIDEHFDDDILPSDRTLASNGYTKTFIKAHCQDPYLELSKLDWRTRRQVWGWSRSRPGRVYEADLQLILQHLSPSGAVEFHYILRYLLSVRKGVAKLKQEYERGK